MKKTLIGLAVLGVVLFVLYKKGLIGTKIVEEKSGASGFKCPCKFNGSVIYLDCKKKNCVGCCEMVNENFGSKN